MRFALEMTRITRSGHDRRSYPRPRSPPPSFCSAPYLPAGGRGRCEHPPRLDELSTRSGMESLPLRQRHLVPFPAFLRQRTVEHRAALVKHIDFVGKLLGPRRHRDLNDPIISHASLLWFCENDPQVHEPEGGLARPRAERAVGRPPPFERHSHDSAQRPDWLAGVADGVSGLVAAVSGPLGGCASD